MKLTMILMTVACLNIAAKGISQNVTFSGKNVSLEQVFSSVEKQTGCLFFYSKAGLAHAKPVSIEAANQPLLQFLDDLFKNQPLKYVIESKTINIYPSAGESSKPQPDDAISSVVVSSDQQLPFKIIVTGEDGRTLSGATITIKKSKKLAITNAEGVSTLNLEDGDVVIVSFVGYESQSATIKKTTPFLNIILKLATNDLDKVVVQAYGTTSQRLTTSNIGKVTAEDIEKQPVRNVLEALQGKVPGLEVKQTNGYASAPFKVEIRGRSAINSSFAADPLYIIDGVPLTVLEVTGENSSRYIYGSTGFIQNGFSSPAGGQSPLFSLNPSDIQSIEVLKDADATAIYGSRGANGVILITTKRGKTGKLNLDGSVTEGVVHVTRYWQLLNTPQYLAMRKEAFRNDNATPDPLRDYDINGTWDTSRYTDWQKELFGGWGKSLNAQAGLSGGSALSTYRIGMGYDRTTNITTTNGSDQRASLSVNLSTKSQDGKFTLSLGANYSYTRSAMINLPGAVALAPNAPAIYNAQGKLNYDGWGGSNNNIFGRGAYPFGSVEQPYVSATNFLTSHLSLGYQIVKRLNFSVSIGYNNAQTNQTQFLPISSQDPTQNPTGMSIWGNNSNKNWIIEPLLTYNATIGKGVLNIVLGASAQQANTDGLSINGSGYTSDELLHTLSSAPTTTTSQNSGEYRYNGIFARVTYNWENKYIINLNGRRDGSSRFGPGKQFGNFGSIGAAWIFTEESWLKDKLSFLSFGKIRGNYGTTGSDGITDYGFLSQYSSANLYSYGGVTPLIPVVEANPDFHWQVNTKLEAAINLGFFHDRIDLQVAYYRDRTGNQLVGYPLPALAGFASVAANSKALVQNSGIEYTATFRIIDKGKIKWSANFNLGVNRNKLLAYPNIGQSPYASTLIIGQPLNISRLLKYTGVDPLTGYYSYYDKNHDGVISYDGYAHSNDDSYPVDLSPKFFGGFGTNFSYGDLTLGLFFDFKKQVGANGLLLARGGIAGLRNTNQPVEVLNRWQKPGDSGPIAMFSQRGFSSSYSNFGVSDGAYTDASYIRLSNLVINYNLPLSFTRKIRAQKIAVFMRANNLLTITRYQGLDPEVQIFGSLPPTRTIVGGLSFNF